MLDAGLEIAHEVDGDIVLVDHVPLLVIEPGDPLSGSPCEAHHVALCPDAADVLRDVAGRVGEVMDLKAHADNRNLGPDQRGIGHFTEDRPGDLPDQLDIVFGHETLEHHFLCEHVLLDYITPEVLDEIDHDIVLVDAALVGDGNKHHGISPIRANFAFTSSSISSVSSVLTGNKRELSVFKAFGSDPEPFRSNAPERIDQVFVQGLAGVGDHESLRSLLPLP